MGKSGININEQKKAAKIIREGKRLGTNLSRVNKNAGRPIRGRIPVKFEIEKQKNCKKVVRSSGRDIFKPREKASIMNTGQKVNNQYNRIISKITQNQINRSREKRIALLTKIRNQSNLTKLINKLKIK